LADRRHVWECAGCHVKVRQIDGSLMAAPTNWRDSICIRCQRENATRGGVVGGDPVTVAELELRRGRTIKRVAALTKLDVGDVTGMHRRLRRDGEIVPPARREPVKRRESAPRALRLPPGARARLEDELRADATRSNAVIAKEVGVSNPTVERYRERLGIDPAPRHRAVKTAPERTESESAKRRVRIARLLHEDPLRADIEVADEVGGSPATVRHVRAMEGIPKPPRRRPGPRRKRAAVEEAIRRDPTKSNQQVADEVGTTAKTTRDVRRKLGLPNPAPHRAEQRSQYLTREQRAALAVLHDHPDLSDREVADRCGLSTTKAVAKARARLEAESGASAPA